MQCEVIFCAKRVSRKNGGYYSGLAKLVERIFQDKKLYICAESQYLAHIDYVLWTFKDLSFIPHAIYNFKNMDCPVLIGCDMNHDIARDRLCINTTLNPWSPLSGHILEFVDESCKSDFLNKYHFYRRSGISVSVEKEENENNIHS